MQLAVQGLGVVRSVSGQSCDTTELTKYVPPRKLRRIDHFTRMTLLAAYRALDDAKALEQLPERIGIILTTGYGPSQTTFDFLDSIIEDGAPLASPLAFSHSVHNIPAGVLSLLLGSPCPQTTICQLHNPVIQGLYTANIWLKEKRVDSVLFGAVDEITPLLEENLDRLCHSARPDEGAAFFLLNQEKGDVVVSNANKPAEFPAAQRCSTPVYAAFSLAESIEAVRGTTDCKISYDGKVSIQAKGLGCE